MLAMMHNTIAGILIMTYFKGRCSESVINMVTILWYQVKLLPNIFSKQGENTPVTGEVFYLFPQAIWNILMGICLRFVICYSISPQYYSCREQIFLSPKRFLEYFLIVRAKVFIFAAPFRGKSTCTKTFWLNFVDTDLIPVLKGAPFGTGKFCL